MNCLLCGSPEIKFNLNRSQHETVKHPEDVTGLICSDCMQVLISSSQEKIKAAYQKALDAGLMDKAKALETFLEEKEQDVRETKKPKRNLIRKGPLRMVRPTANEIRPQQAVV